MTGPTEPVPELTPAEAWADFLGAVRPPAPPQPSGEPLTPAQEFARFINPPQYTEDDLGDPE